MTLRTKLLIAFTALLALALGGNCLLVAVAGRRALVDHSLERVEGLTALLVTASQYSVGVMDNTEQLLSDQMIAQATLAAHLVDVAENVAHLSPEQIKQRLKDCLAQCTELSPDQIVGRVRTSVQQFVDPREASDDLTLLVLKVTS